MALNLKFRSKPKLVTVTLTLDERVDGALEKLVRQFKRSKSEVLREILNNVLFAPAGENKGEK